MLVAFARFELGVASPLIQVRIFRDRAFVIDNAVLLLSQVAFVPVFFFAAVYSQVSLGYSASNAGLYLLVFFAGFAPAAQIGGRMLDLRRRQAADGARLRAFAAGFVLWARDINHLSLGSQWIYIAMAGAGIGLLLGPASTDAVNRSFGTSYGEVTGITQTVRNYGAALGIAVLGTLLSTVLSNRLHTSLGKLGVPRPDVDDIVHAAGSATRSSGGQQAPAALQDRDIRRHRPRLRVGDGCGALRDGHSAGRRFPGGAAPSRRPRGNRRRGRASASAGSGHLAPTRRAPHDVRGHTP